MTTVPPEILDASRRKIVKFLKRATPDLGEPIVALRDASGAIPVFELKWERSGNDGWRLAGVNQRTLDKRMVDSTIVECRVFFAENEDCYLPGVVAALRTLVGPELATARRPLKDRVAQVVAGARIGASGPIFCSGRLGMDNGLGPGVLLGSDLMAMDYIYGVALHEDDERLARLDNVPLVSALRSVVYHFNDLLHVIEDVRLQVENDLTKGYFRLDASA